MVGVEYVDRFCVQIVDYDLSLTSGVSLWFSIRPPRPSLKQPGTTYIDGTKARSSNITWLSNLLTVSCKLRGWGVVPLTNRWYKVQGTFQPLPLISSTKLPRPRRT